MKSNPPSDFVTRIKAAIEAHGLIEPGHRVMAACSGGPDSLSLAHALHQLSGPLSFSLSWCHVDHGLRDPSGMDALRVQGWASALGLDCHVARVSPQSRSEDDARRARYQAFEHLSARAGADRVALGHTADDQAETVLMRMVRGSGLAGLAGIPWRRGPYVRPLLSIRRSEVESFVAAQGLEPLQDPTNESPDFFRNRVRARILPVLLQENPKVVESLCRLAENARREMGNGGGLDGLSRFPLPCLPGPGGQSTVGLNLELVEPGARGGEGFRALQRAHEIVTTAARARPGRQLETGHFRALEKLCRRRAGAAAWQLDLPGSVSAAGFGGRRLWVMPTAWLADPGDFALQVGGPGTWTFDHLGLGWVLQVSAGETGDGVETVFPLELRNFRSGDRVTRPDGHTAKVQDLFVNRKVPRPLRRRLPLLTGFGGKAAERVRWIPGVFPEPGFRHRIRGVTLALAPMADSVERALLYCAGERLPVFDVFGP